MTYKFQHYRGESTVQNMLYNFYIILYIIKILKMMNMMCFLNLTIMLVIYIHEYVIRKGKCVPICKQMALPKTSLLWLALILLGGFTLYKVPFLNKNTIIFCTILFLFLFVVSNLDYFIVSNKLITTLHKLLTGIIALQTLFLVYVITKNSLLTFLLLIPLLSWSILYFKGKKNISVHIENITLFIMLAIIFIKILLIKSPNN